MSSQRYERINVHDDEDDDTPITPTPHNTIPSSPPPSFRSRTSSPSSRHLLSQDPLASEAEQTLADTFDDGDSDGEDDTDDRQRLMRGQPDSPVQEQAAQSNENGPRHPIIQRRVTELPAFAPPVTGSGRVIGGGRSTNDGVFANMAAKPERGEKGEDHPPTYEQAAADATPPYWETTIVAPGMASDEVYVDGLPVGSVFSFVWNGMISMSFQLVGFLLTYLLHTTHAAKNGSRAGLGLTLVQYGFYMKGTSSRSSDTEPQYGSPPDPNSHDFNPNTATDTAVAAGGGAADASDPGSGSSGGLSGLASSEILSYILMIVGWFILIRAISDFLKARRHEQLVLQSPDRGLNVAVIAEGERSETVV